MTEVAKSSHREKPNVGSATPLWVIAAFTSISECALVLGISNTTASTQQTLTTFTVIFTSSVAIAFFAILWKKPWHFYPPSEYKYGIKPDEFIKAFTSSPNLVQQVELAKNLSENPNDDDSAFSMLDAMSSEAERQIIIQLFEISGEVNGLVPFCYELEGRQCGSGILNVSSQGKLEGAGGITHFTNRSKFGLTPLGKNFAKWLIKKGRKSLFFWTPHGSWGDVTPNGSAAQMLQNIQKLAGKMQQTSSNQ